MRRGAERHPFGQTARGEPVERVVLSGGGLTASVITFGAALQDLRLAGHDRPLVLGYPDLASYIAEPTYFGRTVGRYANRIARGRFILDGTAYQLDVNNGAHHLHGGLNGISERVWSIADLAGDRVRLELVDPDGACGYPGTARLACTYRLSGDGGLSVAFEATTDRPTPLNLSHHSYFNLDGEGSILDHAIEIAAEHYLPVDAGLIPTGEVKPVKGTDFDFRALRPIRRADASGAQVGYDHNFCLSRDRTALRRVATLRGARSGVSMDVETSEPGLQFYAGGTLSGRAPGLLGAPYGPHSGLCLEAQVWPDAPNRPEFPQAILRPGERLVQETVYRFARG